MSKRVEPSSSSASSLSAPSPPQQLNSSIPRSASTPVSSPKEALSPPPPSRGNSMQALSNHSSTSRRGTSLHNQFSSEEVKSTYKRPSMLRSQHQIPMKISGLFSAKMFLASTAIQTRLGRKVIEHFIGETGLSIYLSI